MQSYTQNYSVSRSVLDSGMDSCLPTRSRLGSHFTDLSEAREGEGSSYFFFDVFQAFCWATHSEVEAGP